MFYFGFLSSYLPYLLLIAAPICYYFYGTAVEDEIDFDANKKILVEYQIGNDFDKSVIHYTDVNSISRNSQNTNTSIILEYDSDYISTSPPILEEVFTGNHIWTRPPPQRIS